MLTLFDSITTSSPLMMIDSEPGARTKAAALADVTKVGAGVEDDVLPDDPVDEPESGVEPESPPEAAPAAIPEIEILKM